ncbi:dipeptidase [Leucobacter luti]|uniref:Membrane dipeptidase n=1 Tax=Leucobacter luti TaxID=340320 RepID=A0A4Q7TYF7_9MICO|nr:membrane dipeptidase [Leucobacter luti]MBL3698863.1 peptidase M19 [Leucobacter luti]RZT66241.1 membrane dipeptidase [Leucobacter luti]
MRIDSLICSRLDRRGIEELRAGGVDAVTVTCGFWEDAAESLDSLVRWRELVTENQDITAIVTSAAEMTAARAAGRLGIVLGFQNSSFLQGRLGYVELFADAGVRVAQLTYNIQNDIGGSCYDPTDSGLTRFGEEVVAEMNAHGMVVDLSHVGNRTSLDAVHASRVPVAVTHANAFELVAHPRNKPFEVLRPLVERGGVVGVTTYHNLTRGFISTPAEWAEMVARTVDELGVEGVGIGTDANQRGTDEYREWMRRGRWSRRPQLGAAPPEGTPPSVRPDWFAGPQDFGRLGDALAERGFADAELQLLLGGNWHRFYDRVIDQERSVRPAWSVSAA